MAELQDLTGKRFHNLTVIRIGERVKGSPIRWLCKCDCGNYTLTQGHALKSGRAKSCGCYSRSLAKFAAIKHNMFGTSIYNTWCNMKSRCTNPRNKCYQHYGGRGIKVCERWQRFEGFYEDMSSSYKEGLTIDRIDVNGDYYKENCRWVTMQEQSNNKRSNRIFTIDGNTNTLKNLCVIYGIKYNTAYRRWQKGLPIERILKDPLQCGRKFETESA